MKTEQLIRAMSVDQHPTATAERMLPLALSGVTAIAALVFLSDMGVRPDLGTALGHVNVIIKQMFPALLAIGAYLTALRLAHPGERLNQTALALILAVPAVLIAAVVYSLINVPAEAWGMAVAGKSRATCLPSITVMGCAILGGAIWALRRGASVHPTLSGAVAGLLSGGLAATVYAFYCTEDSPLFFATWYSLAILAVTAIGAGLGWRLLRW